MPDNKLDTPQQEQGQPRKFERRRSSRPQIAPPTEKTEATEEEGLSFRFRPEVIALALMVIALLILAAIAI